MKKWERLDAKLLLNHPRMIVSEHTVRLPDGSETQYIVLDELTDFPTVIARNHEGKILLTYEFAYPYNDSLFQFPEGRPEDDETIAQAAVRELREEGGQHASNVEEIGTTLDYHRRSTALCHVMLATDLESVEKSGGEIEEGEIESFWFSEQEIWQLIKDGKLIQKNALAAWSLYQSHKQTS